MILLALITPCQPGPAGLFVTYPSSNNRKFEARMSKFETSSNYRIGKNQNQKVSEW